MYNQLIACCLLLVFSSNIYAESIRYFCPSPHDFKQINGSLKATTNYNGFKHDWNGKVKSPSQYPEFPITFAGANLTNCKNNICDVKCYYYSNIENHLITANIDSNKLIQIYEQPNTFIKNLNCQFFEHIDCPFYLNSHSI